MTCRINRHPGYAREWQRADFFRDQFVRVDVGWHGQFTVGIEHERQAKGQCPVTALDFGDEDDLPLLHIDADRFHIMRLLVGIGIVPLS